MGGQMDSSSIYCASVVYKDYEDKVWVECGQIREEKDTQAISLADMQEVFVGLQSPFTTSQGVFVDLQSLLATLQGVFVDHQSAHATLQRVIVGHQSAHVTSQGVFVDHQSAHATLQRMFVGHQSAHATPQRMFVGHQSAHATLQRVIGCIKCAPAIFFALFGRCFSAGLSTVARQTTPNRSCRRAGDAF